MSSWKDAGVKFLEIIKAGIHRLLDFCQKQHLGVRILKFLSKGLLMASSGAAMVVCLHMIILGFAVGISMAQSGDAELYNYIYHFYNAVALVGLLFFIVSSNGFYGALKEKRRLLNLHCWLQVMIYLLLLVTFIFVVYPLPGTNLGLYNQLKKALPLNYNDTKVRSSMDYLQETIQCCGVDSKDDWLYLEGPDSLSVSYDEYDRDIGGNLRITYRVPKSCCEPQYRKNSTCTEVYRDGCNNRITNVFIGLANITIIFITTMLLGAWVLSWSLRQTPFKGHQPLLATDDEKEEVWTKESLSCPKDSLQRTVEQQLSFEHKIVL